MSGKGSKQRKSQVSQQQFNDNWDAIFGKTDTTYMRIFSERVSKVGILNLKNACVIKATDTKTT